MPHATDADPPRQAAGDRLVVPLRKDFAAYDIAVPVLSDLQSVPSAPGYEALLSRMAQRVIHSLLGPDHPRSRLCRHTLVNVLDAEIRQRLPVRCPPTVEQALRVLGRPPVPARIAWNAAALVHGDAPPGCVRLLSEVTALRMHSGHSMPVDKCIYSRLPLSRHNAARERDFLAWVQEDRGVEAFCRLDRRHAFLRVGGHQGHLGDAPPDFLLRTPIAVYLVDLHARRGSFPRLQAMMEWCTRANALPPAWRGKRAWFFAPLAGLPLEDWHRRGARLGELLAFSRAQAGYVAPPGSTPWH